MSVSTENNPNLIKPTNVKDGSEMGTGKFGVEIRHNRRALSVINQNLVGAHQYPCVVSKRALSETNGACDKNPTIPAHRPITRKFAAQMASSQQFYHEGAKKPKPSIQNFSVPEHCQLTYVEEHQPAKDQPVPMSLEETETFLDEKIPMEEIEMEDIFEEPIVDIDSCDAKNPLATVDYVEDLYAYYRKMEICSCVPPNYMIQQFDINEKMRAILIDWLIEVHYKFELRDETLFLTVNLIDRFLAKQAVVRKKLQLVGLVAMLLACKYEEVSVPVVDDLVFISDKAYTRKEILGMVVNCHWLSQWLFMHSLSNNLFFFFFFFSLFLHNFIQEKLMLHTLQFNMSVPTPYVFMKRFLKAAQSDRKIELLSFFLIELCLLEYEMLKFPPSFLAAAATYTAQCTIHGFKQWNKTCESYSSYTEDQLLECSKLIVSLHQKAATGKLTAIHRKYNTSKFAYAAKCQPAHFIVETQQ